MRRFGTRTFRWVIEKDEFPYPAMASLKRQVCYGGALDDQSSAQVTFCEHWSQNILARRRPSSNFAARCLVSQKGRESRFGKTMKLPHPKCTSRIASASRIGERHIL